MWARPSTSKQTCQHPASGHCLLWTSKPGPHILPVLAQAKIVRGRSRLQHVDLRHNRIGDVGSKRLSKAIKGHPSLEQLDLQDSKRVTHLESFGQCRGNSWCGELVCCLREEARIEHAEQPGASGENCPAGGILEGGEGKAPPHGFRWRTSRFCEGDFAAAAVPRGRWRWWEEPGRTEPSAKHRAEPSAERLAEPRSQHRPKPSEEQGFLLLAWDIERGDRLSMAAALLLTRCILVTRPGPE
eukprot:s1328_g9.t1